MTAAGVLVLVVCGTSDPAAVAAVADALGATLGPASYVVPGPSAADVDEAERAAERTRLAVGAAGEVVVQWEPRASAARVRVQRAGGEQWVERRVEFAAGDPPRERGRVVGLLAGAIWRALVMGAPAPAPAAPAAPAIATLATPAIVPARRAVEVDIAAALTTGLGGSAGRWGASLAGHWRPRAGRFGWRAGLDARAGEIPAAQASAYTLVAGGGASWTLLEGVASRVGLEGHADLLLIGEVVSHLSSDDRGAVRRARWLPGADAGLDATRWLSPGLALLFGAGLETTVGATDVVVRQERTATIAAWRLVARAGLRTRF